MALFGMVVFFFKSESCLISIADYCTIIILAISCYYFSLMIPQLHWTCEIFVVYILIVQMSCNVNESKLNRQSDLGKHRLLNQ